MVTIEQEITTVIVEETHLDPALLRPEVQLTEIGLDSLDVIELVFELESRFGIDIPFNANVVTDAGQGAGFETVGDLIAVVQQLIVAKRAGESPAAPIALVPAPLQA